MKHIKDWYDPTSNSTKVNCVRINTVLLYEPDEELKRAVLEVERQLKILFVEVQSTTDLLAIPAFLAIINPDSVSTITCSEYFDNILEWLEPGDCFYIFTKPPRTTIPIELQPAVIPAPEKITAGFLLKLLPKLRNSAALELLKRDTEQAKGLSFLKSLHKNGEKTIKRTMAEAKKNQFELMMFTGQFF